MSTMIGEVGSKVAVGRKTAARSLEQMRDQMDAEMVTRAGIVAGVAFVALAVGIGVWVYRRRTRRPAVERLRDAVSGTIRDMPGGLKSMRS